MSATLLEAADLTCHFDVSPPVLTRLLTRAPRRILRAVDGVDFRLRRGRTLSVVGESGCGKSTLAKLVVGLQRPTTGDVVLRPLEGADGSRRTPRVQMIFQDPYASLNPRWRVGDIIAEPVRELRLIPEPQVVARRVEELLRLVGLGTSDARRYPHEFSGGQRQRISIARALATEADLLVCDEPTSALDVSVQAQVLNLMRDLQARLGLTYLFISHNLAVVRHMSDDVAVMYLGRIVESGPAEEVLTRPRHPYTRLLLDAVPDVKAPQRGRVISAGEVPNPMAPPPGCPFHLRCLGASDVCRSLVPDLQGAPDGAHVACHHPLEPVT
ncbi:ABC transporter ATP-binding protein [Roseomonas mucosa]